MREHGGVSSRQTAETKAIGCTKHLTLSKNALKKSHSLRKQASNALEDCLSMPYIISYRRKDSSVKESIQDCLLSQARKGKARQIAIKNHQHNSFVEESGCLDISDCKTISESSRSSLSDSSSCSRLSSQSLESDTFCKPEGNIPFSRSNLDFSHHRNFIEPSGVKIKPEYERCKHAVVFLKDCFKDNSELEKGISIDFSGIRNLVKMKPGGSRSPKRHSPVRGNVTTQNTKDSLAVRTTYAKPGGKDSILEGKTVTECKSNSYTLLDDLSDRDTLTTGSPKQRKKHSVKGEAVMKEDISGLEHSKTQKKKASAVHGDSDASVGHREDSSKKVTIEGHGDSHFNKDHVDINISVIKDHVIEDTDTPKKRGRKPKIADSTPDKRKFKKATEPHGEFDMSTEATDASASQTNGGKKVSKSPHKKKKKDECENHHGITNEQDGTLEKETVPVKSKVRGTSESPSPVRRKRSPKKEHGKNESPKSKKAENTQKAKKEKDMNENDDQKAFVSHRTSVDEVIEAVVNENIAMLNKSAAIKPQSGKNKQESPEKKQTSPSKEKKQTPKVKKSVKNKSQEEDSCSVEKKKPRSRSNSASPKKGNKNLDSKLETKAKDASPPRKLDFDDDLTKIILEKSKLPFPSDFQYKYTSSGIKTGLLGLEDLISKVNNAVKDKDDNLNAMFGKAEEPDYYSDDKSLSPSDASINTSTDSDKTIIEYGDLPENTNENAELSSKDSSGSVIESLKEEKLKQVVVSDLEEIERHSKSEISVNKVANSEVKEIGKDQLKENYELNELLNGCDDKSNDLKLNKEHKSSTCIDNNAKCILNGTEENSIETVSVFDIFGLTLKKQKAEVGVESVKDNTEQSLCKVEDTSKNSKKTCDEKAEPEDDDVLFVSETKADIGVVVLSDDDDDEPEHNCTDRTGYESLKETTNSKVKPKFTTVNNVVEPKPLDVLHKLEKAESKKENAFACSELDEYLNLNKENIVPVNIMLDNKNSEGNRKDAKVNIKDELKRAEPDFDEIDGHVFVSFASENALKAHVSLEKKMDWLTEVQMRKIAHLKQMKERQHDSGSRRITDVKSGDEQKQNFRGIPMRLMKYQKMLRQELENILLDRPSSTPEKSPSKTPTKTTDITKIKGWKNKFQNAEELQEATGLNISESGRVHWKTEERLVKNLDPEEIKDIGLDLKKKRRKLVNYNSKKKSGHGCKAEDKDSEMMEYEYEIDELAIIESDVYNEDEDKPPPEKIPYNVKYSSQHKYGVRKLFVKKMKLDAEDERILQKLGTQKQMGQKPEVPNSPTKRKKGKQIFSLSKLTLTMAMAAVSAFDKTLLNRAIGMEKAEMKKNERMKKKEARLAKKEGKLSNEVVHNSEEMIEEPDDTEEQHDEIPADEEIEDDDNDAGAEDSDEKHEEDSEGEENSKRTRRHSTASRRSSHDLRRQTSKEEFKLQEDIKVEIKTESPDACTEPGCRYGCICHLCKLSDSGEEKEPEFKPPCDKEYCRLGCICDSIDTKSADSHHCRKPGCMFECKCPPKQPKPDIPRERDHRKKKKGKGTKKKKRTPEKKESEGSGKEEEPSMVDDNEWEPPSKRKRGPGSNRFANLPKRETTYRLAKNLDAVSRKAMEVYASSEMFTEQKVRRRRSDQGYEDGSFIPYDIKDPLERSKTAPQQEDKAQLRLNEVTGLLEISDEESDEGEVYPEDLVSCARIVPYDGPYKRKRDLSQLNKRKGGPSSSKRLSKTVIDLVDSDKEDNSGDAKDKSDVPSTSSDNRPKSLTHKMGLTNKISKVSDKKTTENNQKWKTQMVCLKAKKKSDSKAQDSESEIKLLEIMSNCNWEIDRTNMLSKISHVISKGSVANSISREVICWGAYLLEFLPKADKPAVIPPELKSKLPNEMFSIRIKVTKNTGKEDEIYNSVRETVVVEDEEEDDDTKNLTEEEKKKHNMRIQKKLIEKIKFAERLRNLIIAEEKKGVTQSKFSVSRSGIEKALKKYKTQLWKAYTGTSNLSIQQLKQALQAARSSAKTSVSNATSKSALPSSTVTSGNLLSPSTLTRLQTNQGFTVVTSVAHSVVPNSFINLTNLQTSASAVGANIKTVGNLVIHNALPASGHCTTIGTFGQHGLIENIENVSNVAGLKTPVSQASINIVNTSKTLQMSGMNPGTIMSDVVFMPIDKNINPTMLPPGAKLAVVQPAPQRDGSPLPFAVSQQSVGNGQLRFNPLILPNSPQISSIPIQPLINPAMTSLTTNRPTLSQGSRATNASVVTCLSGPQVAPHLQVPANTIQSSGNCVLVNGTSPSVTASYPNSQCVVAETVPNSGNVSTGSIFPLKNISNIGSEHQAASVPTASPSIYPIKFANSASNKTQPVTPAGEMIGLPKVASLPMKVVQDGNRMLLIPMSSPMSQGVTNTTVAASSSVSFPVVTQASAVPSMANQRSSSPVFLAVSVHNNISPASNLHKPIPAINVTVDRKNTDKVNKEPKELIQSEEKDFQKLELDISDKGVAQGKKFNNVKGKTKELNGQASDNCDNINNDSDDNFDTDSLASSTRSLSSLSDIIKTEANAVELKADHSADKLEEDIFKDSSRSAKRGKRLKSDDIQDILDTAKNVVREIAKELEQTGETIKERNSGSGVDTKEFDNTDSESKADTEYVVLDDTDEDMDQKELNKNLSTGNGAKEKVKNNKCQKPSNFKQNKPLDLLDSIDCEHEISKMGEHLDNDQDKKDKLDTLKKQEDGHAIRIEDSEESDVDVTSYEVMDSVAYMSPVVTCSSQQGTAQKKRKSHHRRMTDDDDFQIKKIKKEIIDVAQVPDTPPSIKSVKSNREKFRRLELSHLFQLIENTVFKYNVTMQHYHGKVPKHMILQEALNLLSALKHREEELRESLDDGRQYKESLEAQLKQQIESFVKSGVPEPIIKNFLKSVEKSLYPVTAKQKRKLAQMSSGDLIEVSVCEESDNVLDFDALSPAKVQENWTKLVDAHLCSYMASPNVKVCGAPVPEDLKEPLVAETSVQKDIVPVHSENGLENQQDVLGGGKFQESCEASEQKVGCAVSHKSSSDDDEIRSSTGDTLIDHESDFFNE